MRRALAGAALTLATCCAGVPALAQTWVAVGPDGGSHDAYDSADVLRAGDRVELSIRSSTPQEGGPAYVLIVRQRIECRRQTGAILSIRQLSGDALVRERIVPAETLHHEPLMDDSPLAPLYARFCPGAKPLPRFEGPPIITVPAP